MTIFSKIITGKIPCYRVAEDDKFIAFLDIQPLVKGHVLVVPKVEVDKIFDVPDDYLSACWFLPNPSLMLLKKLLIAKGVA